jgi:WD40 repeat protein/serine/threonine protein kinase
MIADSRSTHEARRADTQHQVDQHLLEFERNWSPASLDAALPYLPPAGSPLRGPFLLGLVQIDLRRRWQIGQHVPIEDYLRRYPELGTAETVSVELILVEYLARERVGLKPKPAQFEQRFPGKQAALERLVHSGGSHSEGSQPLSESVNYSPQLRGESRSIHGGDTETAPLPEIFGRYRILKQLGQGGMGTVYLATDLRLDRQVALKVPRFARGANDENLQRFYREARATATINHPNLCPLYDIGEVDGVPYLTMPFIEGWPLTRFTTKEKRLSQFAVAATVRKIALAVHEAHKVGVIHRDLKPGNIMVNKRGEPIVMDFGLARWVRNDKEDVRLTRAGSILGAPVYMSPEQVYGDVEAMGPPCDVYSLGVILFELLTQRLPFEGGNTTAVLAKTLMLEAPKPSAHRPDVDPLLDAICVRAMAKAVADRYPTMLALAEALGEYMRLSKQEPQPNSRGPVVQPLVPVPVVDTPTESHVVPAREKSDLPPVRPSERRFTSTERRKPPVAPVGKSRGMLWLGIAVGVLVLIVVPVLAVLLMRTPVQRGTLLVTVVPEMGDYQVTLDDQPLDRGQLGKAFAVDAGDHRLAVTSKHFHDVTRTVRVQVGFTERVEIQLAIRLGPGQGPWPGGKAAVDAPYPALGGGVRALAVAPGTGLGLSGGDDFNLAVWDLDRHTVTHSLPGHLLPITGVAISRTGDVGVSCGGDRTVRVWNVRGGVGLHVLTGHTDWPRCVAVDGNGGRAASGDDAGLVLLWDSGRGQLARTLTGHAGPVRAVVFSADGTRLVSAGDDGTIRVWDVGAGNLVTLLHPQAGAIRSLALHPDNKHVASGHADGNIRLWNLDTRQDERVLHGHTGQVRALTYSGDGTKLYSGSTSTGSRGDPPTAPPDNSLRTWDVGKGTALHYLGEVPGGVNTLQLSSDGNGLLTAGDDRNLRGWDPGKNVDKPIPPLPVSFGLPFERKFDGPFGVEALAVTPEGALLLAGSDGTVYLREKAGDRGAVGGSPLDPPVVPTPLRQTKPVVRAVAVSADGRLVASGGFDKQIRVWNRQTNTVLVLDGHEDAILSLAFFPDGDRAGGALLASGSADRTVIVWDLATKSIRHRLTGHADAVTGVAVPRDGKRLVSAGLDGAFRVWDPANGQPLLNQRIKDGAFTCLALFPDGTRAITGGRDKHFRIWDVNTAREIRAVLGYGKPVSAVAVSPCGRWFATASEDGLLHRRHSGTFHIEQYVVNPHSKPVSSLVFTPDGRALISASQDRSVKFWSLSRTDADPAPLLPSAAVVVPARKYEGAQGDLEMAAISPDGGTIVAGGSTGIGYVWDAATGKPRPSLTGHGARIHGVAFLPSGKRAITCGWDNKARLWNLATGKNEATFEGHTGAVIRAAVTQDGRYLVTGSQDRTVRVWEIATGRVLRTLEGHSGSVWSVAVSADGFLAVSGSYDRTVRWWDLVTGRQVGGWAGGNDIHAVALSPDGARIAAGGKERVVSLIDVATGREITRFPGHEGTIAAVSFSPDGRLIASSGDDRTARVWSVETGREVFRVAGSPRQVWSVRFTADGKRLLTASNDGPVCLWDLPAELWPQAAAGAERVLGPFPAALDRLAISPDGKLIAACGMDRTLRLLDFATGQEIKQLEGLNASPRYANFSADGKFLVAACEDGTAPVWSIPSGTLQRVFTGHARLVWMAVFSPDGKRLLTGGQDPYVLLHDVTTGDVLQRLSGFPRGVHCMCFLPASSTEVNQQSTRAIVGGFDGSLSVWDLTTGREVERWAGHPNGQAVSALMLTPDGHWLATSSYDGQVRVWDVPSGKQVQSFAASTGQLWTVTIDPTGQRGACGGSDGVLRFWDRQSGIVAEWSAHTAGLTGVRFTPDGRRAVSSSQDRTLRVWGAPVW